MKGSEKTLLSVTAACIAAVLALIAAFVALPSGTSTRYVDGEVYAGEVVCEDEIYVSSDTLTGAAHDHGASGSRWVALTANTTLSANVCYYLTEDITRDISISYSSSSSKGSYYICLNGHMLTGTGTGPVISLSGYNASKYPVMYIFDCGGGVDGDGNYDNVHYYKYRGEETLTGEDGEAEYAGEAVSTGYVFYETGEDGGYVTDEDGNGIPVSEDGADGCVRGGLITGGAAATGGGIYVNHNALLYMYGGTIAGNCATSTSSGGGVYISRNATFYMYGGAVEGNWETATSQCAGGVGVGYGCTFNMYGGEIKHNYSAGYGGGISTVYYTSSSMTINMYGGSVFGNYAASGSGSSSGGGGVFLLGGNSSAENQAYFNMYGGIIAHNVSKQNGGGICVAARANLVITGGVITENVALSGNGGGIYVSDDAAHEVAVSGATYIYGNYEDGTISNLGCVSGWVSGEYGPLALSGEPGDGARIGITPCADVDGGTAARITRSVEEKDALVAWAGCILSDDHDYGIRVAEDTDGYYLELYLRRT